MKILYISSCEHMDKTRLMISVQNIKNRQQIIVSHMFVLGTLECAVCFNLKTNQWCTIINTCKFFSSFFSLEQIDKRNAFQAIRILIHAFNKIIICIPIIWVGH